MKKHKIFNPEGNTLSIPEKTNFVDVELILGKAGCIPHKAICSSEKLRYITSDNNIYKVGDEVFPNNENKSYQGELYFTADKLCLQGDLMGEIVLEYNDLVISGS